MTAYQRLQKELRAKPRTWLITGVAGFIGSHLLETLLRLGQTVVGLDNYSTGSPLNLNDVERRVGDEAWARFLFHRGTVIDIGYCREACKNVDYVLHQAGFVSVPLSIEDPIGCHDANVTGTLNLLVAARDNRVRRVVYASSSAAYGDDPQLPKVEEQSGRPLSPYGASKVMGEMYARLFVEHYGLETIGLRYFNVFGLRQNPRGGYAAVIPQWITAMLRGEACVIHGDGEITRDFCPVADVVQANLLAATAPSSAAVGGVYNVGLGAPMKLDELYTQLAAAVAEFTGTTPGPVTYGPPRAGDILHSGADTTKIQRELRFAPEVSLATAFKETVRWYQEELKARA